MRQGQGEEIVWSELMSIDTMSKKRKEQINKKENDNKSIKTICNIIRRYKISASIATVLNDFCQFVAKFIKQIIHLKGFNSTIL